MNEPARQALPAGVITLLVSLYLAQGLPSGFFAHALPALLREQGVSLTAISLAKLLALPWFFKFSWAPLIDRHGLLRLGHYRGWILLLQTMCCLPLFVLSLLDPVQLFTRDFPVFMLVALLINTCMATQDVATDALAVRLLPVRWRGVGNSIQVAGYKLGMLAGGNGLLIVIASAGWNTGFLSVASVLLLLLVPVLLFREPPRQGLAASGLAAGSTAPVWQEWQRLFALPGWSSWIAVLLTYKLADALGSSMVKPMLVDAGYSLDAVGRIGLVASVAGMAAAFAGGLACRWFGVWRCLFYGGLLQAIGLALYALVAAGLCTDPMVYAISVFEQMADAISTVCLFAAMMGYCRLQHEGGDYTLQMALFMVLSGTVSLGSGALATWLGLPVFFIACGVIGLVALYWVVRAARDQAMSV